MDDLESGERTIGCLPGETPASILHFMQERRYREALATRDAEIRELRTEMENAIERAASANEWWNESRRVILDKDAEIERLKAENANLLHNIRLRDEIGAERENELYAERALREKRERQLVWAARHDLMAYKSRILWLDDSDADFQHGLDWDGTDSGLLAAIDEVCP